MILQVVGGSWFDHIKGWYNNCDKYNEEMIKLCSCVVQLCLFSVVLSDAAINKVVERVIFKNMKSDSKAKYEFLPENIKGERKFLLKGQWKSANERFNKAFEEKMKDIPSSFVWNITELHCRQSFQKITIIKKFKVPDEADDLHFLFTG
uniref:Sulfotransferase n=1 Tax=Scleropages formosus TaxID=113540 RepID=A0A8C9R0F8_SCLFO